MSTVPRSQVGAELGSLHSSLHSARSSPGGQDSEHGGRVQGDIVTWRPSPISALPTPNLFLTLATCPSACAEPASRLSLTHRTCPGPTQMATFQVTRNGLLWPRAVPRGPATGTEPCLCHLAPLSLGLPIWSNDTTPCPVLMNPCTPRKRDSMRSIPPPAPNLMPVAW